MGRYLREISVAVVLGAVLVALAVQRPEFFNKSQWLPMLASSTKILIVAIGMTLVITARHIDVSVGSQFSVCGVVAALLAQAGQPWPVIIAGTLAAGAALGAINGLFVAGLRLPSIVVTLATFVIGRELMRMIRKGALVHHNAPYFQWFGLPQHGDPVRGVETGEWLIVGIGLLVFLIALWAAKYLSAGRAVFAVGSDQEAARLAGIRPKRVVWGVFTLMGIFVALAAILEAVQSEAIQPDAGKGMEMQVIAAVVVGGTAIAGGRGTLLGTLLGVALLAIVSPALTYFHISAYWEKFIDGLIILAAVASDAGRK